MPIAILVALALLAAPAAASPQATASAKIVKVDDDFFSPKSLSIKRGVKVKWVWQDTTDKHDVRVKSGPVKFHSAKKRTGTYSHTFKTAGTYKIYCSLHAASMKMTVKVK